MLRNPCTSRHPARRDLAFSTQPSRTNLAPRSAALLPVRADGTTSPLAAAPTESWACVNGRVSAFGFIDQSVLLIRIVVGKILLQSSEEIPLAILPAFQPDANQRGDRLAHARIDRLGVPRHLIGETGSQSDGIPRFDFARKIPRLLIAASAAFGCRVGVRHMSSECLIPMHLRNLGAPTTLQRKVTRKLDRINAMSAAPTNWRKCAIKLVGAGIGTAVAGPLGTALGGSLGGLFSEEAEKFIQGIRRCWRREACGVQVRCPAIKTGPNRSEEH